ncbi:MAG: phosphatase PAP2 family protein [Candidatus Eremiobacteraeota bacterium]|nr:phosphatase PAP2 family protein [Candidatus Eremiobacteraeota bacterium]
MLRIQALFLSTLAVLLATVPVRADERFYYLKPNQIDLTALLPPPPDVASALARADEAQVAAAVAGRNRTQLFDAQETSARTVFFFEPSIGAGFTAERLPATARFFSHVGSDVKQLIDDAKMYWDRPRPDGMQKRRGSYPSGHAAFAAASSILLAQLLPNKRDAVFTQARTFAENRILLGRHYPSDVASGWTAGTLAAFVMMRDRAFERDFAAVKSELHRANL